MTDTASTHEIIRLAFNGDKPGIIMESDWYFLTGVIVLFLLFIIVWRRFLKRRFNIYDLEIEISGSPKASFKVQRNEDNLYVAHRILIELITRKAVIPIDSDKDVIEDIYNSWYKLFQIIREEIKTLPGRYLKSHDPTIALIGLTTKILNEGLRPHLTEYQAKFRKWYEEEKIKSENNGLSPQDVQKKYPEYESLIISMKQVNSALIYYSLQLNKLLKGH